MLARFGYVLTISGIGGCSGMLNDGNVIRVHAPHAGFHDPRELTRQGVASFQRGDVDAAVASFKQAIAADETNGPAHNNLGRVYFQQGQLKRAADAFSWAMEFMPGRPEPINNLGLILESTGKIDEAIELYQSAHTTMPEEPEYLANLVRARMRRGGSGADVREELQTLRLIENRPEWRAWVEEKLNLHSNHETNMNEEDVSSATTIFPSTSTFSLPPAVTSIGPDLAAPNNGSPPASSGSFPSRSPADGWELFSD